ncbi:MULTISPECIES: DUF6328 family protein [Nocardia]|uniref:Sodium:proton antiporter n=1 Tax=Nocardia sputorum TaxID=2984338 RepID=A0ABN6U4U5_9NOCA|nr:DUF6328 family protein [Nocardia sputorum]BDT91086.1 hypothetical protein IFM12275_10620 [Nocardia sputorum]BDT99719.1 hypothetical protein IFM12276_27480 [Nocardia sputorum]
MPEADDGAWARRARGETELERLDRNWSSLVQELRVVQTGVQFLFGALLVLPFQASFGTLSPGMRALYLATLAAVLGATVFLIAPVSWHRILFRRHRLGNVVSAAHRCAMAGVALLGLALIGAVVLVVDYVTGTAAAVASGVASVALFTATWLVAPWRWRSASEDVRADHY